MDETTTSPVATRKHGDVLIILSNNPPVNALSIAVRTGIVESIRKAQSDETIQAIVLACEGQTFFAGADISEFGKTPIEPLLPRVVETIEACSKPVIAAIHGNALGGGLEVALGCHYRIADPSARLGTPEVKLGLLPGAGGTQRLPRVAGVQKALEMTALGNPIGARAAFDCGLVDRIAQGDLISHAVAFAEEVRLITPIPKSSTRSDRIADLDPGIFETFTRENARKFRGFEAPFKCIEAVKAACTLPFGQGLIEERKLFLELMGGEQSQAQRYFFFAERKAAKIEGLPENAHAREIHKVGVVGAGTMGGGISMNFLSAGIPVKIVEMSRDALDRGTALVQKNYDASAAKGKLSSEAVEKAMSLLSPTLEIEALSDCDLIIEAVYENLEVKTEIFKALEKIAKPKAILASNTSYLDINQIAASIERSDDVVGLHFFSPANVMKLLEVVRGTKTAPDVLLTAMQIAKKIKKVPVVAGVCHGFIGNRMLRPRQIEATKLVLEGASVEQVDRVHVEFGMPMGPFQMADLAGVDIGWHRDPERIESLRDCLCAIERWGQKKGAGFYDYDEKRRASPSPVVQKIIEDYASKHSIVRREISDQEIVERTLYSMVNEGSKILEEKIAQRASDIDVVWVYGYGWPIYRGGPMFWADSVGLREIVDGLKRQEDRMKPEFSFSKLLLEKAEANQTFTR